MKPAAALALHRDAVRAVVGRRHAANPRIFGSVATGCDRDGSDLDLLVDALPGTTLFDLGALQMELEQLLGVHVDVLTPGDLALRLRNAVLARELFLADRKTQQAIVRNLMVIGETANRIHEDDPEFAAARPALPWTAMRAMRNRIAHGYFDIDMGIVRDTVQRDLPPRAQQLAAIQAQR